MRRRRRLLSLLRALAAAAAALVLVKVARAADAVGKLAEALGSSRSYKVRAQAAALLGRMKDPRATQALVRAAASDPHPVVRVLVIKLLARSALVDRVVASVARQALSRALHDEEASVRRQAAASLVELERGASPGRERPSGRAQAQPRGPTMVAIGTVGDRSGRASRALRERMRAEIQSLLRREASIQMAEPTAPGLTFLVDGTISKLTLTSGGEVEATCAVELVVSRPPRGIITIASGEATVQKPRSHYRPVLRDRMEMEAMEHAVRSAHENLARFLAGQ
jgi:HEAT repeat protein